LLPWLLVLYQPKTAFPLENYPAFTGGKRLYDDCVKTIPRNSSFTMDPIIENKIASFLTLIKTSLYF
jgi:hypothetical protein